MMKRPRDSQKSKVYAAERRIQRGDQGWSYQETQDFVDRITRTRWWLNRQGPPFVYVKDGRGTRWALAFDPYVTPKGEYRPATINLPRWARDPIVVLHELTHILTPATEAAHGETFCGTYLALVKRFMDIETRDALRQSFREHGVKWTSRKEVS
jgi:putative metallohydrolase (TIGR04338 family)